VHTLQTGFCYLALAIVTEFATVDINLRFLCDSQLRIVAMSTLCIVLVQISCKTAVLIKISVT